MSPDPFEVDEHKPISSVLGLVILWYASSVIGNITSKMILTRFPYPCTVMIGPALTGMLTVPVISAVFRPRLAALLLTGDPADTIHISRWKWSALLHTAWARKRLCMLLGVLSLASGLFHRIALLSMHVSFAHTIKAIQPAYSCFFSYLFFQSLPARFSLASLVLVVIGIMFSAMEESSHSGEATVEGLLSLQLSVAAGTLGNVIQKFVFSTMDKAEVFCLTNATASLLNFIVWFYKDVPVFYEQISEGKETYQGSGWELVGLVFLNSVTLAMQHFTSLSALSKLSPTTHSLVASMKRVLVIGMSAVYFGNLVSVMNACGAGVAVLGVSGYEWGKRNRIVGGTERDKQRRETYCAWFMNRHILPQAKGEKREQVLV